MYETEWTFKTWIKKFENVDLPIGDLAKAVKSDKNFPDSEDYTTINNYLISKSHNDIHVLNTFRTVWNFYISSR